MPAPAPSLYVPTPQANGTAVQQPLQPEGSQVKQSPDSDTNSFPRLDHGHAENVATGCSDEKAMGSPYMLLSDV